jgi:hypothetical protein
MKRANQLVRALVRDPRLYLSCFPSGLCLNDLQVEEFIEREPTATALRISQVVRTVQQ